jgi:hypothetical protein
MSAPNPVNVAATPDAVAATKTRTGIIGRWHDYLATTFWAKPSSRNIERIVFALALLIQVLCCVATVWYLLWGWIALVLALLAAACGAHLAFVDKCAKSPKSPLAKATTMSYWAFIVLQIGFLGFSGYVLYCYIYAMVWGYNGRLSF